MNGGLLFWGAHAGILFLLGPYSVPQISRCRAVSGG